MIASSSQVWEWRLSRLRRRHPWIERSFLPLQLFAVIVVAGLSLFAYQHAYGASPASDAMDIAQIGRHIAAGHGFSTSLFRPVALPQASSVPYAPDVANPPLYPLS